MTLPIRETTASILDEQFGLQTTPHFIDERRHYKPPKIVQINSPEGRSYEVPGVDPRIMVSYPSMSRVTGAFDKEALTAWRERIGDKEADHITRVAGIRGTGVHALAESYLKRDEQEFVRVWKAAMPNIRSCWKGMRGWIDGNIQTINAIEHPLYSHQLRLAGTTDFIGTINDRFSVLDFKTSLKLKQRKWIDGYFMQAAGYAKMWQELYRMEPDMLTIVIAVDNVKDPQVFQEDFEPNYKKLTQLRLRFYKEFGL